MILVVSIVCHFDPVADIQLSLLPDLLCGNPPFAKIPMFSWCVLILGEASTFGFDSAFAGSRAAHTPVPIRWLRLTSSGEINR